MRQNADLITPRSLPSELWQAAIVFCLNAELRMLGRGFGLGGLLDNHLASFAHERRSGIAD